jgi:hypothetical protein
MMFLEHTFAERATALTVHGQHQSQKVIEIGKASLPQEHRGKGGVFNCFHGADEQETPNHRILQETGNRANTEFSNRGPHPTSPTTGGVLLKRRCVG